MDRVCTPLLSPTCFSDLVDGKITKGTLETLDIFDGTSQFTRKHSLKRYTRCQIVNRIVKFILVMLHIASSYFVLLSNLQYFFYGFVTVQRYGNIVGEPQLNPLVMTVLRGGQHGNPHWSPWSPYDSWWFPSYPFISICSRRLKEINGHSQERQLEIALVK